MGAKYRDASGSRQLRSAGMRPADATVVSPDVVTSPITGKRGAVVVIDVLESGRPVGTVVLGDTLVLATDDGRSHTVVARRAHLVFFDRGEAPTPLASAPAEIVPLLRAASGQGELGYREHVLVKGSRVRVREGANGGATTIVELLG